MARHLRPVEAAILIRVGLVEAGIETPEEQADAVISVLRNHFAKVTRADDQLVAETLRVFGLTESEAWAVLREWCAELGRDEGEVFEHVFAPPADLEEEE